MSTKEPDEKPDAGTVRFALYLSERDDRALEYAAFVKKTTKTAVVRELLGTLPEPPEPPQE